MTYGREAVGTGTARVTAVAEPRADRRLAAAAEFGVPLNRCVSDWSDLAGSPDLDVDAVIITTPDRQHTAPALAFLARGLPLLLEKPMAPTEAEAEAIVAAAAQAGVIVCVAHVLRYSAYTAAVKAALDGDRIGEVVSIQHLEPVGWWHQAHSFVRGNWRRSGESNPMLMAKCCHDVDWLGYLVDRPALRVSSFGGLQHFTAANRPAGAGTQCLDCAVEPDCPYSAKRIYLDHVDDPVARRWPLSVLAVEVNTESITEALRVGPYGRCVYDCDNDVVDNQVVAMRYTSGLTATFTMTAFTPMQRRQTRLFGSHGSVDGDGRFLTVTDFRTGETETIDASGPEDSFGHDGGDGGLVDALLAAVTAGDPALLSSDMPASLASHRVVWAAERARLTGTVVTI